MIIYLRNVITFKAEYNWLKCRIELFFYNKNLLNGYDFLLLSSLPKESLWEKPGF